MDSDREIEVAGLTPEEAWSLFKEKVGGEDIISPEIKPIAEQVARECGRLPLALITVGRALRKENQPPVWRNALQELKTSRADQIKGMAEYVFRSLKFSYKWLSSDRIRACFLYCALYPEDEIILVDELIEYWMAEGLIDEEGSIQTEKDKGHAYLKELKDACMIESVGNGNKHVRMHDLIRDLAINITRKQFMVKTAKESPKEEEWIESLERVSLMNNPIEVFKGQPNCPRLTTLLLQHSYCVVEVTFSDTFFKHMHNLRVLDLSYNKIKSLPDSLSDLVNLDTLILTGCTKLEYLPSLAKLQKLRQLKLGRLSSLKELPDGLQNLVKLRHLDISRNISRYISRGWRSFPSGALFKMSCLEILSMERSRWRISYGSDVEANSTVEEIIRLKNLMRFSAKFADVLTFNSFINKAEYELLKRLDFFRFTLSREHNAHNVENESTKKVRLPAAAKTLRINGGSNFIQLPDIFGWDDLRHLISCGISRCDKMEWIVNDGEIVLPSLQRLMLSDLHSFKGLCKGKAHGQTLRNLRELYIRRCHELKYLIPIDLLVNNLENLQEISIINCNEMEGIISSDDACAAGTMTILPKLKKLQLLNLPKLTSIWQGKLVCDSLCAIKIDACPKMKKLPFLIKKEPPVGMKIIGSKEWWETLEWEDPQLKELLQPFFFPGGWMDPMTMNIIGRNLRHQNKHEIMIGKCDFNQFPRRESIDF